MRDAEAAGLHVDVLEFGKVHFAMPSRDPESVFDHAMYDDATSPRSAIVAVAQYLGTSQGIPMPWGHSTGYQWRFTSVMPLARPVSIRGAQGLWRVPGVAVAKIAGQVPEAVMRGENNGR
ncbi:MAG: hypothetical protein PHX83_06610 [Acidobacteriia bacterium]|nr:hypothetical protein [Terriglobia bacterium]